MDAGGGESLAGEMGRDEIRVLLGFDEDERLVLGVAGLEDFLQLLPLVVLGDLVEFLLDVLARSAHQANHNEQIVVQKLLRGILG